MSLFMHKHAVENVSSSKAGRKPRKRSRNVAKDTMNRVCRIEPLEKREYLAADPISVGVVYTEQYQEDLGDRFYVAWVGGEEGCTTLDSLVINLDKNGNGVLDEGENFFDVSEGGLGVYSSVPFTVVSKTADIGYSYQVEDGGMVLTISFTNFHAGDSFVFNLDLDEYQTNSSNGADNAQVEGGEMGGSITQGIAGATVSAIFSSDHYLTETWAGTFVDDYDNEYTRSEALTEGYDSSLLPYDKDDNNEGIDQAGIYDDIDLTPKPIIISGYVYADHDVDCNYDLGQDKPLANVEITLVGESGSVWTTTTDVNGYYEFVGDDLLPGTYQVYSESNIVSPEGWQYFDFCAKGGTYGEKITPLEIDVSGMQGGDVAPNNNFAKVLVSTIDGYVFEDLNDSNNKEPGEEWDGDEYPATIELWRIDYDSEGVAHYTFMESQTVDSNGYYKFTLDGSWNEAGTLRKLPEKTYEIREIFDSEDYSDGKDYVGSLGGDVYNDLFTDIYVGYGENGYNYNFGELKLGSIAGNVWEDRNDNGLIDKGEEGIAGVTVELYQWDGANYVKIDETKTDENGSYLFDNLDINKEYAVKEVQPGNYDDGKDSLGTLGGSKSNDYFSNIEVGWDDHGYEYNFGELKLGSIAGNVYEDRNNNGVFDSGETGIAGVTVELYEWSGADYVKVAETTTAEDGSYLFDKLDINKEYAVREKQPEAYDDGKESIGSLGGKTTVNDEIREIPVNWDDHGVEYNFGELMLGSIAGNVYEDRNDNGVKDEGEIGIGAVTVELYQLIDGEYVLIGSQLTAEDGSYSFDKLDINQQYAVKERQPETYSDGKDSVGTLGGQVANDYISAIDVQWDDHGYEYNFGELKLGSVSGYVYHDANDNGIREEGEAPIANVTVELYQLIDGEYTKVRETKTDENGFYKFDSLDIEQTYGVKEIQPEEWADGKDSVGTLGGDLAANDYTNNIRVAWDQHGEEYNFGELLPPGSLSGYVYEDDNNNGVKEDGEKGIKNVIVTLYVVGEDGKATVVDAQTTDEEGYYKFDNLDPGKTYVIRETQPTEYYDGKDAVGTIFGTTVGALGDNDEIVNIDLPQNGQGVHYDFGELRPGSISGYVYVDNNNNGIKESDEPGIPGTTVTLQILNESTGYYENLNRVLTTDANGYYIFDKLEPCRIYRVVETQPTAYVDGKDTIGSLGGEVANDVLYSIPVKPGDAGVEYNFGERPKRDVPDVPSNPPSVSYSNNYWGASPTNFPYIWYQPTIPGSMTTLYGGGGFVEGYSWKLGVLNAAGPRDVQSLSSSELAYGGFKDGELVDGPNGGLQFALAGASRSGSYGKWILDGFGEFDNYIGVHGMKPVVGDWDADGDDDIGFFVDGDWYLDADGDGFYDLYAHLGETTDQPVTGDWDGDGKTDVGVFGRQWESDSEAIATDPGLPSDLNQTTFKTVGKSRAKNVPPTSADFNITSRYHRTAQRNETERFREDIVDHVFQYGAKDDVAVTGDWNGDGRTEIGYYRNGSWYLDMNGDGRWEDGVDKLVQGRGGDYKPVVGDWNGDGIDNIGLFADGEWFLDTDNDYVLDTTRKLGQAGDMPIAGDWDGDGVDEIGVYRPGEDTISTPKDAPAIQAQSTDGSGSSVAMRD